MSVRQLLVACAVLAVLAVLLSSAFERRRDAAASAGSARNLQQWGIALNLFLIDNDNQLPDAGEVPVTVEQQSAWFNALPVYLSRPPLASLPPAERPRPGVPNFWMNPVLKPRRIWDNEQFFFAYAMNQWLQPYAGAHSLTIYELENPSRVVFLSETDGFSPRLTPENLFSPWGTRRPNSDKSSSHVLFCDGHVELVPRSSLLDPANLRRPDSLPGPPSWFKE